MNTTIMSLMAGFAIASTAVADNVDLSSRNLLLDDAAQYRSLNESTETPVEVGGFVIARWQYNDDSDTETQFSLPYSRVSFSADVENWGFAISGEWSDYTKNFEILDAFVTTQFAEFDIRVGQFVPEFFVGYTVSPLDLVAGEYGVVANNFGQGRSQGIQVARSFGDFTATASYTDGFDVEGGPLQSAQNNSTDFGLTGRLDWNVNETIRLGGAYSYQDTEFEYDTWTVDGAFTYAGFGVELAYVTSDLNGSFGDNYGLIGTVTYDVTERIQPFVQYEHGTIQEQDLNIVTVGVNQFFTPNVRLTTSVGYSFDPISKEWDLGRSGWAPSEDDEQILVNAQLSFSF